MPGSRRIPTPGSRWRRDRQRDSSRNPRDLLEPEPIGKMVRSSDWSRGLDAMWKTIINRDAQVDLELSRAERKLLLTGLVYLPDQVEAELRSTPVGVPLKIRLGDLDNLAGHVAGEANHARSERTEEILSGLFEKIEELLTFHAQR
jgi:hypothetical protein